MLPRHLLGISNSTPFIPVKRLKGPHQEVVKVKELRSLYTARAMTTTTTTINPSSTACPSHAATRLSTQPPLQSPCYSLCSLQTPSMASPHVILNPSSSKMDQLPVNRLIQVTLPTMKLW